MCTASFAVLHFTEVTNCMGQCMVIHPGSYVTAVFGMFCIVCLVMVHQAYDMQGQSRIQSSCVHISDQQHIVGRVHSWLFRSQKYNKAHLHYSWAQSYRWRQTISCRTFCKLVAQGVYRILACCSNCNKPHQNLVYFMSSVRQWWGKHPVCQFMVAHSLSLIRFLFNDGAVS